MADIHGQYSLQEVAHRLSVSPSWINKLQKETGIGGPLGIPGKRALFTEKDIFAINRARILRDLRFSLKEIGEIYTVEMRLAKLHGEKAKKSGVHTHGQIGLIFENLAIKTPLVFKDKHIEEQRRSLSDSHARMRKEILNRAGELQVDISDLVEKLQGNS